MSAADFAFLVAAGDYDRTELRPLKYARADILSFQKALIAAGYREPNIVVMHDDPDHPPKTRYLSLRNRILEELTLLLDSLEADDSLIVAFVGHGVQFSGEKESFFCPNDARLKNRDTLVSFADVLKRMERSPAGRKLLLVDACRNDPQSELARSRAEVELESVTRPQEAEIPKSLLAFFSCSPGQRSFELPELGHGIFFHHVLKGWNGAADGDKDGRLELSELESDVRRETKEYARVQLKALQSPLFKGEKVDDWILRTLAAPLSAGTRAGQEWDGNSLQMKFRWCPAGDFSMGSPPEETNRSPNEESVSVSLSGFWLSQHEATQAEWESVMGITFVEQFQKSKFRIAYGEGPRFPMYFVSHDEASEFARRFTQRERDAGRLPEGWEYRLPTEAQWEYGCRAGTRTATAFGDRLDSQAANFDGSQPYNGAAKGPWLKQTTPVGSYSPNDWGLCDMHGNLWEWCRDAYAEKHPGGRDPETKDGAQRVHRGGGWSSGGLICRSATRGRREPTARFGFLGFRLAIVPVDR